MPIFTVGNLFAVLNMAVVFAVNQASSHAAKRAAKEHSIIRMALDVAWLLKIMATLVGAVILVMAAWDRHRYSGIWQARRARCARRCARRARRARHTASAGRVTTTA